MLIVFAIFAMIFLGESLDIAGTIRLLVV